MIIGEIISHLFLQPFLSFESITCKIEWRLHDLNKHAEFMQIGQFLTSKKFYNPKCPSVKWELRIYPNTSQHNFGIFVSIVQVGLKDSKNDSSKNDSLKAKFVIYTLDDVGNKIFCCTSTTSIFKYKTESDKYQIFEKEAIDDKPKDDQINNRDAVLDTDSLSVSSLDSLVIFCQVEFVPYNIECEDNVEDCSLVSASQDSLNMFKEGILTDFIIEIGDETINTHRFILAKSSIVFQRMFEQMGMSEAQNGKIKIVDFSPECFRIMLETFYTGKIEKNTLEKHSEDLFAIAHKYEVKGLMQVCETSMASNIDASNFVKRCHYAELYHLTKLAKACVNFLSANKEGFLMSKEWNEFKVNNKDLAFRLMKENLIAKDHATNEKEGPFRKVIFESQRKALEDTFLVTNCPDKCAREELANEIGLTERVIEVWFQNRRLKERREERNLRINVDN
ncbi:hypothetical protein ACQ4LE_000936 [Meloidogyne hapla]